MAWYEPIGLSPKMARFLGELEVQGHNEPFRRHQLMSQPPSTMTVCPVM